MISENRLRQIVGSINAQPQLAGCIIGFQGNNSSRVLQEGTFLSVNYGRVLVIIEEVPPSTEPVQVVVDSSSAGPPMVSSQESSGTQPPARIRNGSRVWPELAGAGLSCGLAVWSGVEIVGGLAAEAPSAGTSTALVVLGWVGLGASATQCGNGLVRSWQAVFEPDDNSLQRWDDNTIYSRTFLVVDAIGIVSSLPSLAVNMRNLLGVLERRGGLIAADRLILMNRAGRQSAIQEAFRRATRTAEDRALVEAALREAGLTEREIARLATRGLGSMENALQVTEVITNQTARALTNSIKGVIQGTAGIGVSASPASWTGSGSGSVNALLVHVLGG